MGSQDVLSPPLVGQQGGLECGVGCPWESVFAGHLELFVSEGDLRLILLAV